ncbi:sel1 repeat family protein [Variovorax sp. PAMC28562]|uniref:tetratricopeptide repeat protein n=1 Tax=Variovorax sp. PAMC28562 TaxID=2762323 RepID=UPI00164D0B2E|nr:DUF6396 domain-containing protein [Variovorax sp. PAMC28562]QNK75268.1 sel1 repeat family protein [Variovorax sp. PAMC28562]
MNPLPRNMNLKAFDPHRTDFACKHEAEVNPPISPEAEALFQQGMAATSYELIWPQDTRDYAKAAQLWQQATAIGHWKAAMNLAGLYEQGLGVERDTEKAVLLVEGLMKQGVPAAFDKMGTYHQRGVGVKGDTSRAYAFWQLAADMGSAASQGYLGQKTSGTYDNPSQGFWGNRKVALEMLECGAAQGDGKAAFELGVTIDGEDASIGENYASSLKALHNGVKFGSAKSANYLSASFSRAEPLSGNAVDRDRSKRYSLFGDALELNPDLRFPNLDKVLPLPPAALPVWDGKRETLIDAAKGLIPAPVPKPTSGAQRTGRAHIPQAHVLAPPSQPMQPAETAALVPRDGYWLLRLHAVRRDHERVWEQVQVPQRYAQGEAFEPVSRASMGQYATVAARTVWHYVGEAVPVTQHVHPLVIRGIARVTRVPEPRVECRGHRPCPRIGIWFGDLPDNHPLATRYNRWDRQAYLEAGQSFPDPAALQLEVAAGEVRWLWCDNANQARPSGIVDVTLTDLSGAKGPPSL